MKRTSEHEAYAEGLKFKATKLDHHAIYGKLEKMGFNEDLPLASLPVYSQPSAAGNLSSFHQDF